MESLYKKFGYFLIALFCAPIAYGQEFNAQITVNHDQIQRSDVQIFKTLETSLFEFVNNTKWTAETYALEERIECNIVLVLSEMPSQGIFVGNLQVQYARPIYNSSYLSTVLNHQDQDLSFNYIEYDRLEFNPQTSNPNLVSTIAFYLYMILGLDADSFEKGSGSKYYQEALRIVNFNQSGGQHSGWRDGEGIGQRNRYWISENLNNSLNDPLFEAIYMYHREGLDLMYDKGKHRQAKEAIIAALMKLEEVHKKRPTSILLQMFLNAKRAEIIRIFGDGEPVNTVALREMLEKIDPTNRDKYENLGT
ncbi:MAG: DUF4835 family protein [Cryomorphaceae bacterium]|nr:DUF4835 family protein [Cryomorphaceae bacterium]